MEQNLTDTKVPNEIKKEILLQSGGLILGALFPPAVSVTLGFINNSTK